MIDLIDWRNPDYTGVWAARSERLEKLRQDVSMVGAVKAYYKDNPVEFINDWVCTFDPRHVEVGKEALTPFVLFEHQVDCVNWLVARWRGREDGLIEKSRDMGVSWLCSAVALWMWLFYPGVVIGFGSRKREYVDNLGDPKSIFWKIRTAINYLPQEFKPLGYEEKKHALAMRIMNPENGSVMVGEAGNNIGRGNRTSIYFKDESAFYEQPEAIEAALSQTSNCKIDVSTPNGAGNPFYRKRHGGRIPVFVFDWKDDPRKGPDWYEKQKSILDPVVLAQEVDSYIDESGFAQDKPRAHGNSHKGTRCLGKKDWGAKGKTNVIGVLLGKTRLYSCLLECNVDSEVFHTWVTQQLLPLTPNNAVIVMDNTTFHKRRDTLQAIKEAGLMLEFLPPYSLQLNPIEKLWAKTKAIRKRLLCSIFELFDLHIHNVSNLI